MSCVVYTLSLGHGCFYVGKTHNLESRLQQHSTGEFSSAWIKFHTFHYLYDQRVDVPDEFTEHTQTLRMMKQFGIHRVRGDIYNSIQLPNEVILSITNIIRNEARSCLRCGRLGHFFHECLQANKTCERCGRNSHEIRNCHAKQHFDGYIIW